MSGSLYWCVFGRVYVDAYIPGADISSVGVKEDVLVYGMPYIFAFSFEYVGLPFIMSFNTVSTATGNGWITLVTNMTSAFIVRIPLAYVLAFLCELGVRGIAISIPIATAVGAIISFLFYKAGIWKKHILL